MSKMSAPSKPLNKRPGRAKHSEVLEWTAVERVRPKRWWWFVGLVLTTTWLASVLWLAGNWSASLLTLVAGFGLFVVFARKPEPWNYRLEGSTLTRKLRDSTSVLDLSKYRAFTTFTEQLNRRTGGFTTRILLLPQHRFRPARDIFLTDDVDIDLRICKRLDAIAPYEEEPTYLASERLLTWVMRAIRVW